MSEQLDAIQAQLNEMQEQYQLLIKIVKETMNLMPYTLRSELNDFTVALTEELKSKDSGKMADSIAQLAKAMDALGNKIDETSLVHLQVSGTVEDSLERMLAVEKRLEREGILSSKKAPNGNQPDSSTQPFAG